MMEEHRTVRERLEIVTTELRILLPSSARKFGCPKPEKVADQEYFRGLQPDTTSAGETLILNF